MAKYRFEERIDEIYSALSRVSSVDDLLRIRRRISALYRDINSVKDNINESIINSSTKRIIKNLNDVKDRVIEDTLNRYAGKIPQFGEGVLFDRLKDFYHNHLIIQYDIDKKSLSIKKVSVKPDVDAYSSGKKWMRVTKRARDAYLSDLLNTKIIVYSTALKHKPDRLQKVLDSIKERHRERMNDPNIGYLRSVSWRYFYKNVKGRYNKAIDERLELLPQHGKYSAPYWFFVEYGSVRMPGSYPNSFPTPVNQPVRLTASIRAKLSIEARKEMERIRGTAIEAVNAFENSLSELHRENLSMRTLEAFDKSYKRIKSLIRDIGKRAIRYV